MDRRSTLAPLPATRSLAQRWARPALCVGRAPRWYLGLLATIGVVRLLELRRSAANEAAGGGTRAAPASYPVMVAAHVALLTLPLVEASYRRPARPRTTWAVVLVAATALRVWSIRSLGAAWNVRAAVPADLRPVERGPYAYIRHPNYLAVILEFAAVPMVAGAWISAAVLSALNAAVLLDRIRSEERLLESLPGYRESFGNRARFIPGVF